MQPIKLLSLSEIPNAVLQSNIVTTNAGWREKSYFEKCKDSTYEAPDPRKVSSASIKAIFEYLYTHHGGKCHWCNIDVKIDSHGWQPDTGNIDHLKTMRMGRKNYYDGGHVLSCYRCNSNRNQEENKIFKKKQPWHIRLSF